MRRIGSLLLVVGFVGASSTARAQPGQTPPAPPGYAQPQPVPQLTPEEQRLLARGLYTDGQIVGGGLIGSFFGLGLGHAMQGRFGEKGWVFLVGEGAGITVWWLSLIQCLEDIDDDDGRDHCNETMLVGSMMAVAVLRIWEIVDVWTVPAAHNRKVRRLRNRLYQQQYQQYYQQPRWGLYAAPTKGGGGVAGVAVRF